jgi:hypothetical protein
VTFSGLASISTVYIRESEQEQFAGLPAIHVPSVDFTSKEVYEVTVLGAD